MDKKIILIIVIVLILITAGLFLLARTAREADNGEIEPPAVSSEIKGRIYSIEQGIERGRILVAEGIKGEEYTGNIDELVGRAVWFSFEDETEIFGEQGEGLEFDSLGLGDKVEVLPGDLVLETYPAQTTAKKIILVEKKESLPLEKECYIGGCSGELCADEPEAISTCEILPGMECLKEGMACELVGGRCTWVLSEQAAQCFLDIEKEYGETATQTRIGYLFEKAHAALGR